MEGIRTEHIIEAISLLTEARSTLAVSHVPGHYELSLSVGEAAGRLRGSLIANLPEHVKVAA